MRISPIVGPGICSIHCLRSWYVSPMIFVTLCESASSSSSTTKGTHVVQTSTIYISTISGAFLHRKYSTKTITKTNGGMVVSVYLGFWLECMENTNLKWGDVFRTFLNISLRKSLVFIAGDFLSILKIAKEDLQLCLHITVAESKERKLLYWSDEPQKLCAFDGFSQLVVS